MARQPIFDKDLRVYAYELLFRGGPENFFRAVPNASSSVIADSITLFDWQTLAGEARAFVNVDEAALHLGAARLLPPERVVIEILETVSGTPEIVAICRELRAAGYLLALDDFVDDPAVEPLVDLARFLKVDFRLLDPAARERVARKYSKEGLHLLAEKVESQQELTEARRLGYTYFQGYFFCKPSMMRSGTIPPNKLIYLELLAAVTAPELNYTLIEEILKRERSLVYRLLRYLNSPLLGLRAEVRSVRHALSLLGENEFRRWVSVFSVMAMASGKPPELIRTALSRAYFCEEIAAPANLLQKGPSLFFVGLLSVTDALLDQRIADVLRGLPIAQEIKIALTGGENPLRDVYRILLALERADWPQVSTYAERLHCSEDAIPTAYQFALRKASAVSV